MRHLVRNPAFWYVGALAFMWPVQELLAPGPLDQLREWASTNLANLRLPPAGHPVAALVVSAFVTQASPWVWPPLALSTFAAVSALGARRAVALLATVHMGVSLVTEGMVWWRIRHGSLPGSEAHTLDTGPSYLVVAAMTVAVLCARPLWLRGVWLVLLALVAPRLLDGLGEGSFSAIGHLTAFTVALAAVCAHGYRRRRPSPTPATA